MQQMISKEFMAATTDKFTLMHENEKLVIDKLSEKLDVTIKQADQTRKSLAETIKLT